jgi:hypothetical protein
VGGGRAQVFTLSEALAGQSVPGPALDELALLVGHIRRGDRQALETLYEPTVATPGSSIDSHDHAQGEEWEYRAL